ncbi:transport and Golgi organization protein 6 homolog [Chrysoperla carnea]|uniref:transport and Golgi organization protein 6 homolog n=1 Tax=Chrysoperla carnea TaxID=189513 RepID=UPI001D068F8F|nr:transport and Golgi organization protein 6 homolog [Chrysoperla carnea]
MRCHIDSYQKHLSMDGHKALELLIFKDEGMPSDLIERLSINLQLTCDYLKINRDKIQEIPTVVQITGDFCDSEDKTSILWDYICCGFYILIDCIKVPEDDKIPNLIPGVGIPLNVRSQFKTSPQESLTIIQKYTRLRSCAAGLLLCNKNFEIRKFILSRHLGDLLAALFQLSFAPLKKPIHATNEFQITEEIWEKLQSDRLFFRNNLNNLLNSTYLPALIREIMVLMGVQKPPAPRWLKSESSRMLCDLLVKKDGILALCYAMFESYTVDIGAQWKQMEILQKLIFDIGNSSILPNFYENVSSQILKMLSEVEDDNSKHLYLIITRLFCKSIIEQKREIFETEIFSVISKPLAKCTKIDINEELVVTQKYENLNTDDFGNSEGLFLSLMLLDILIDNSIELSQLTGCINSLEAVANKTKNVELKTYITQTCTKIRNGGIDKSNNGIKSEFDQALEEICDPLLPVRAHGLMSLKKLIETNDITACARKQYILCIFQENLKNTDSYIYLAAINGIAALSTIYTDNVLDILTEEYVNMKEWRNEEEHHRVRLNLGEVLVQVTKKLGEMAPKYKTVLLNTFLFGVKDDDNLIRTSSLSNLGQICEVLGYKLGNATIEILHCLDSIIETDKAIEARRAAVMVMYQLLKGFGPDTIVCLKEALLPIYRKLKDIYIHEKDDTMRLHAQLALEELNNSTRNFLLPPTHLNKTINIFGDISLQ